MLVGTERFRQRVVVWQCAAYDERVAAEVGGGVEKLAVKCRAVAVDDGACAVG